VFPFNDKVYKDSYDTRQVPNCRRKWYIAYRRILDYS
jgi:hypothetical protein